LVLLDLADGDDELAADWSVGLAAHLQPVVAEQRTRRWRLRGVRSGAQDISTAIAKGKFARAARRPVIVTDGLVEQVERLLTKRCIDLIALARRAGEAVAGYEKVRLRLRGRTDAVVVIACDGADGSREKMKNFADGIPLIECLRAEELGAAFGREKTVHVALGDGGLAEKLQFEAQRLKGFRPYG
ncbi:MAG: hypothetical protein VX624_05805, partial [Pseudomonadota bacterium]|nr:hypothetical protein [Pseudomonadota bacterium]